MIESCHRPNSSVLFPVRFIPQPADKFDWVMLNDGDG
jgi:hypothetical protein